VIASEDVGGPSQPEGTGPSSLSSSSPRDGGGRAFLPGASAGFPPGFIDDVRRAVSIAQVVEQHVSLKKAGRTLKGRCPFHSEKTPSFHVDEAKGFYHCFGCGAGGDVFKFVMQLEALSFPEAVRSLAARAGLAVPERAAPSPADELRERVLAVNAAAQEVFRAERLSTARASGAAQALAYLSRRGLAPEVLESFGVGWAPESWTFLGEKLRDRFAERELLASGLLVASDRGKAPYDRFRGRVTFPIRAVSERIVGFGGRIVGDGEPKYLNSPETPVYTKGQHLFGLDRARVGIRRAGHALLVEGYLDVISLHAQGVDCAVAVLGTALTPEQARLLSRFTRKVVLNFDGDEAGLRAARRSVAVLLAEGIDVRVMALPSGVDPADRVRALGGEAYLRGVESAEGFFEFVLRAAAKEHDLSSPTGRVAALQDLLPYLIAVDDALLRSELVDAAAQGLGMRHELVKDEVRRQVTQGRRRDVAERSPASGPASGKVDIEIPHAEALLVAWMIASDRVRAAFRAMVAPGAIDSLPRAAIFRSLLEESGTAFDVARVVERLEDEWQRRHVSALAVASEHEPPPADGLEEKLSDLIDQLGMSPRDAARRRKAEVDRLCDEARRRGDHEAMKPLLAEASELGKAIHQ
jgi:DNA primase